MKRIICLLILSAVVARADEASHMKLAEEALSLMDVQKNIEQTFDGMKKMQMAQFKSMNLPPESAAQAAEMQDKVISMIQQEFSWDKVKADYVKIYADTFTDEELEGLIEFYKGPIGHKFIEKTPELMQRSMEVSRKLMSVILPKIQELTRPSRAMAPPPAPPMAK